jgi:lysyl-tRNA synthetase class 2
VTQAATTAKTAGRGPGERSPLRHAPRVFATALALIAVLCVLAALNTAFGRGFQPVRQFVDNAIFPAPANLAYGLFLVVLAGGLSRRKRAARLVMMAVLLVDVAALALFGAFLLFVPDEVLVDDDGNPLALTRWEGVSLVTSLVIAVVALVMLLAAKRQFYGRTRKAAVRKAAALFVGLMAVSVLLGGLLVNLFPGSLTAAGDRWNWAAEQVFGGAVNLDINRLGNAPGWVNLILSLLGAGSLFITLFVLFRSQLAASMLGVDDELAIRRLLAEHGERDSLGYFATRRDKAAVFAPNGTSGITFRVVAGVCLASGDPLGDPDSWDPVIAKWLAECREFTWSPAVMGASEEAAEAYARAGLKAIQLGDEAILAVEGFTLDGPDMRPVRQAVNRVERAGYTTRIRRHADIPADELTEAIRLAELWRDTETERGFSMALGRLGDPSDGRCVLVEAVNGEGDVAALLSFAPWGHTGLSLDLMRRDRKADNGLMEFMVSAIAAGAPQLGVRRISLNFAVFRSVFEDGARIGAGPVLRAWRGLLLFFSRWWQLESLYRSNVKYRPRWEPRFLVYGDRRDLAKVGLASAIAEGFVGSSSPSKKYAAMLAEPRTFEGLLESHVETAPVPDGYATAPEQVRIRLAKVDRIRERGGDPYPVLVSRDTTAASLAGRFPQLTPDTRTGEVVAVAGRVVRLRDHGKLCFATVRDWSGDVQVMLTSGDTGEDGIGRWRTDVDLGDHVSVSGEVVTSRRGELSVLATGWELAAKCLRPLPDKRGGLTDPEARVRQRYLDLVVRPEARDLLRARSAAVNALRQTLIGEDYLEVETPILQPVHGGANARPFTTHINAYDMRLYLRIAPELYLKRLCVGGVERVFELGRTFRNEGVSYKHNPEFTMLEAYEAYADYNIMRHRCQDLIKAAAVAANGREAAVRPSGELDLSGDWPVIPVNTAISEALGEEITTATTEQRLRALCEIAGVPHNPAWGRGAIVLELYERLVEEKTSGPTFYTDFPTDVSPLTRQHREDPLLAERWDLVVEGTEIGTAYSELVDPAEQRRRLTAQSLLAAGGDAEAMELDEDFLTALEYSMPPTGGLGIGVDRLIMLLTGTSIRETLLFPLVRP